MDNNYLKRITDCPVCGLDQGEEIFGFDGKSPTYGICSCCGSEYVYDLIS